MLKLLIVEDNVNFVKSLINNIIGQDEKIKLVGIATNGIEAINMIKIYKPNIILLDLQIPQISGTKILEKIASKELDITSYIIVITGTVESIALIKNREYIYSFYTKPINSKVLADKIHEIHHYDEENKIKSFITQELDNYKFNHSSIAYKYLEIAIYMAIENPNILKNMERDLFSKISKEYNTKPINIKWSIEKLIQSSYKYTEEDMSTKSFINYLVNKYKKIS